MSLAEAGYAWDYSCYVEKELRSSNHFRLLHASAEKRCRAILKFYLDKLNNSKKEIYNVNTN